MGKRPYRNGGSRNRPLSKPSLAKSVYVEALRQAKPLEDLTLADLQKFSAVIGDDVYPILSLQSCLDKRAAKGGVSPKQVAQAIADAKNRLV